MKRKCIDLTAPGKAEARMTSGRAVTVDEMIQLMTEAGCTAPEIAASIRMTTGRTVEGFGRGEGKS